jgi:hypothetical protein
MTLVVLLNSLIEKFFFKEIVYVREMDEVAYTL